MVYRKRAAAAVLLAVVLGLFPVTAPKAAPVIERLHFGGQPLAFEVPDGLCVVDKSKKVDAFVFESMRRALATTNTLLAYWIDCDDYRKLHAGTLQELGRYVLVMSPKTTSPRPLTRTSRAEHIELTAALYQSPAFMAAVNKLIKKEFREREFTEIFVEDMLAGTGSDAIAQGKEELEEIRQQILNGEINLFPLGQDETAAYLGYAIPNGPAVRAGVGAATLINTIPLILVSYDIPASKGLYSELHRQISGITARAIAISEAL
jgi:hypothetical protein